ncbi:hypothetical protein KKE54_04655, partial [bacterium]|nr:hypothetical protein [bacterium]
AWSEFDKRHQEELLVTLTYKTAEQGILNDSAYKNASYILTYPVSFYPNSSDFRSYGYALMIILLTLLVSGIVVYRYRKNRTKPFIEVRYEE